MAKLPRATVEALALMTWGPAQGTYTIRKAVEIANQESRFETTAHNTRGVDSYGLWQIEMSGAYGPERRRRFGLKANTDLFDPATNARVAHELWKEAGNSFSPWVTEKAADAVLNEGARTSPGELVEGIPVIGDVASWAGSLAQLLATLLKPEFWKRIGIGTLGIGIILAGIIFTNKDEIAGVATKVVTKGKA